MGFNIEWYTAKVIDLGLNLYIGNITQSEYDEKMEQLRKELFGFLFRVDNVLINKRVEWPR